MLVPTSTWFASGGPVIIIEDNDKVVANPMQTRHREEDVLELVIRDLTYAVENLPEVATANGRVNVILGCKRYACQSLPRPLRLERRHTRQRRPGESQGNRPPTWINNSGISLHEKL